MEERELTLPVESSIPKRLRCLLGTVWEIYNSAIEYDQGRLDL
jgi:hypothetical protein